MYSGLSGNKPIQDGGDADAPLSQCVKKGGFFGSLIFEFLFGNSYPKWVLEVSFQMSTLEINFLTHFFDPNGSKMA